MSASLTAVTLALTACGGGSSAEDSVKSFADMEEVNLKVATLFGPDNYNTRAVEAYTDAVSEATEGKVSFEYFYAGSLLPQSEMAQGLSDGTIDFAHFIPTYTPADYPVDTWANKLGFLSDSSPVIGSTQARTATWEFGFEEPAFQEELASNNIIGLMPRAQSVHTHDLICKDPVDSLKDIGGKRIRVAGEAWSGEVENLGGVPVNLPGSESYTALQQGVTDCFMGGAQDIDGMGLTDIAKHYTPLGLTGFTSSVIGMNSDTWESLPVIAQEAFIDSLSVLTLADAELTLETNYEFFNSLDAAGVEFHEADPQMQKKIDDYHEQLLTGLSKNAPAEVADPEAAIASYQDSHRRWKDALTGELGFSDEAATWADYVAENDEITEDFEEWSAMVKSEIIEPNSPLNAFK